MIELTGLKKTRKCEAEWCGKDAEESDTHCIEHGGKPTIKCLIDVIEILRGFEFCHFSQGCPHDIHYEAIMEYLQSISAIDSALKVEKKK